ncbi:MAG: outer membrane beta-barrel protein [Candidatus Solibacter usitatus]|nr:outer membrane beta-barrel protein [Candidatus Solibacter usitatus]
MKMLPARLLLVALSFAAFASAQSLEVAVTGGVMKMQNPNLGTLVDTASSSAYKLDNGWQIGFRGTLNSWRYLGQEFGYSYNRTQLINLTANQMAGMAVHQGLFNMLAYATKDGSRVRPFVAGGGHFNSYAPPGTSVTSGGASTKVGFNYGGGIKFRLNAMFTMRMDFHQFQNGKPFGFLQNRSGLLKVNEVTIGFGIII